MTAKLLTKSQLYELKQSRLSVGSQHVAWMTLDAVLNALQDEVMNIAQNGGEQSETSLDLLRRYGYLPKGVA